MPLLHLATETRAFVPLHSITLALQADWGNVPTWIGGAIAAIVAIFAIRSSIANTQTLQILRDQKKKEWSDERSAQARGITIWYQRQSELSTDFFDIWFSNSTHYPAYQIIVEFNLEEVDRKVRSAAITHLPPKATFTDQTVNGSLSRLRGNLPAMIGHGLQPGVVCIIFTDAAGVRWKRDLSGRLAEVLEHNEDGELREELLDARSGESVASDYFSVRRGLIPIDPGQ